jgi:hypothetical protein
MIENEKMVPNSLLFGKVYGYYLNIDFLIKNNSFFIISSI